MRLIVDALTPGTPRHVQNLRVMQQEADRLRGLLAARAGGAVLHPLDEIALTTQEILAGFGETVQ